VYVPEERRQIHQWFRASCGERGAGGKKMKNGQQGSPKRVNLTRKEYGEGPLAAPVEHNGDKNSQSNDWESSDHNNTSR
jgi:hypothetical protein